MFVLSLWIYLSENVNSNVADAPGAKSLPGHVELKVLNGSTLLATL
jgi:hypothetical protein